MEEATQTAPELTDEQKEAFDVLASGILVRGGGVEGARYKALIHYAMNHPSAAGALQASLKVLGDAADPREILAQVLSNIFACAFFLGAETGKVLDL